MVLDLGIQHATYMSHNSHMRNAGLYSILFFGPCIFNNEDKK